jgi:hypothetical protein
LQSIDPRPVRAIRLIRPSWVAVAVMAMLAVLALSARPAFADKKEASRHFKLGVKLYEEQKYSEALVEFERAHELAPNPLVLYNIAATYRELSRYDESIQFYDRFLTEGKDVAKKALLQKATQELEELRARVGSIVVEADVDGATVTVDDRMVGTTPLPRPLVLPPGEHTITVNAPDARVMTKTVRVTAGDETRVTLTFPVVTNQPIPDPVVPDPVRIEDRVIKKAAPVRRGGSVGLGASMATNVMAVGETGAPMVGLSVGVGNRITVGVDAVIVAFAVVPSVRIRLTGGGTQVHAILAAPISITDGGETDVFVAGAGGLGARFWASPKLAIRGEAMVSVAGGGHGVTVPVSIGAEVWF